MKLFISGSQSIKSLAPEVQNLLHRAASRGRDVLVGDANGVDRLVQDFLHAAGYRRVTVYHVEGAPRNNIGNWPTHEVESKIKSKSFRYYVQKDEAMARDADVGLMIWDLRSSGTMNNVLNVLKQGKEAVLFIAPRGETLSIRTAQDAHHALSLTASESKEVIEKKLKFSAKLDSLQLAGATQQGLPL